MCLGVGGWGVKALDVMRAGCESSDKGVTDLTYLLFLSSLASFDSAW